jgi:hypothetical protein
MLGMTKLFSAVATLADNLNALAGTVAEVNAALRGRLQLDAVDQSALDHEPAEDNGTSRRGKRRTAP